jgi:hypothetical protein
MSTVLPDCDAVNEFHQQGFAILKGFIEPEIIDKVRTAVQDIADDHIRSLLAADKINNSYQQEPFETRLISVYHECSDDIPTTFRSELHHPGMFGLFFHSGLLDIVEQIIGPEVRLFPNYSVRPKLPDNEATLVLWHQDAGYTQELNSDSQVGESRMVNLWTPLVPATAENGCMQFIPRTHKLGVVPHVRKNKFYLQIEDDHLQNYLSQAIDIPLEPGDVVLFSNLLFHRGLPNSSHSIRWSCDWRYQDSRQPTLRSEDGHIARSRANSEATVRNADHWSRLSFR